MNRNIELTAVIEMDGNSNVILRPELDVASKCDWVKEAKNNLA